MSAPRRLQLSRKAGYRKPANAVVVARPSRWGNPWTVAAMMADWCLAEDEARIAAVDFYRDWLNYEGLPERYEPERRAWIHSHLPDLVGHDLACWCPFPADGGTDWCHAAVLLTLANPNGEN